MKGRKIETNSGARVSVLAVIALVFLSMIIAISPVSADLIDNSTDNTGDPDLIVSVESYDTATGGLWVAVSSDPENVEHNTFYDLLVTVLIDGTEVDSHIESIIEEHYYYPVPLSTLPEGNHEVKVIIDYSWKTGKTDTNKGNNVASQSVTVGPQAVQNDFGLANCQVIVVGGIPTLTGDVTSDGSKPYIITVNADGSKFCEISGSGAGAFTPQILSDAVGDHVVDLSIAPADSGVVDPNSDNDAVGLSYTIPAPVPTQDLAVTDIDFTGSGDVLVLAENVDGTAIESAKISLLINGVTVEQIVPDGSASPYRASFSSSGFNFEAGQGYLATSEISSTILDPIDTNNIYKEEIETDAAPIPEQDARFENGAVFAGTIVKTKVVGLSDDISSQIVKINAQLDDNGPKHEIGSYDISSVEFINVEADLLNIFAPEDLYGTHTLRLEVVAPFDSNGANNFAETDFTYAEPEDPVPELDTSLIKLDPISCDKQQVQGTFRFLQGTASDLMVYVEYPAGNLIPVGKDVSYSDGTFKVTPKSYGVPEGKTCEVWIKSESVQDIDETNNHLSFTVPVKTVPSSIQILKVTPIKCGADQKLDLNVKVTGSKVTKGSYWIEIGGKASKVGETAKFPVGTTNGVRINIQPNINKLSAGDYVGKVWIESDDGRKSNVCEFKINVAKKSCNNNNLPSRNYYFGNIKKNYCNGEFTVGFGATPKTTAMTNVKIEATVDGVTKTVYGPVAKVYYPGKVTVTPNQIKKLFGVTGTKDVVLTISSTDSRDPDMRDNTCTLKGMKIK